MCVICDGLTVEQAMDQMVETIDTYGWAVQHVERDRYRPPWAYTVGLTRFDRPELVATGLVPHRAGPLLNGLAAHSLHDEYPSPGEQVRLVEGPLVEFVPVSQPLVHLLMATEIYGPIVCGLQVVWADDRDHWPWDRGFRAGRGGQPVLGPRCG